MADKFMGIIYNGTGGHSERGARAVLVYGDELGYSFSVFKTRWRPTIPWAAWLAKRWAVKENRKREQRAAKNARANQAYLRLLKEQGGLLDGGV